MLNQSEFATLNTYMVSIDCLAQIRNSLWRQDGLFEESRYQNPSTFILSAYILPFSLVSKKTDGSKILPSYMSEVPCVIAADRILAFSSDLTFSEWYNIFFSGLEGMISNKFKGEPVNTPIYEVNGYSDSNSIVAKYVFSKSIINGIFENDYTDYSTITSYYLFLPYIGYVDVDYFNIRNGFIIEYSLDVTHGIMSCSMYRSEYENGLTSEEKRFYNTSVNAGIPITITGGDLSIDRNRALNRLSAAANFASGALSLIPGLGNVANSVRNTQTSTVRTGGNELNVSASRETKLNKKTGRQVTTNTSKSTSETTIEPSYTDTSRKSTQQTVYRNKSAVINTGINAVIDYWNLQTGTGHAYEINSNTNWDSSTTPILYARKPKIIESTKQSLIEYQGRPTNTTVNLSVCRGYLQVGAIHLELDCTFDEITEIEELLIGGVIINKSKSERPDYAIDLYGNLSAISE